MTYAATVTGRTDDRTTGRICGRLLRITFHYLTGSLRGGWTRCLPDALFATRLFVYLPPIHLPVLLLLLCPPNLALPVRGLGTVRARGLFCPVCLKFCRLPAYYR